MEAAAIGVVFTWRTTFACQLRLRLLTDRGVIQASTFPMPGSPWTSIVGLVFLALVIVGLGISGRQSALYFWHKTAFLVVVLGIPVITLMLWVGWLIVRPRVVAHTGDRMKSVWTEQGPRYGGRPRRPRGSNRSGRATGDHGRIGQCDDQHRQDPAADAEHR